ncbi:hypothetical protein ASZ78_007631 [Callipepla squamata]|uniref:Cadherin domain-containing protein n=1 Tax=Callipepla squamata TaxID=9009 RepID=A0A226MFP9_CALSU|nr:hypothetical protein ASZ78_007631 [Callipepla squamata]
MGVGGAARRSWGAALLVLQAAWALVGGQVRYSVPEEAEAGTVVGRLAQDLGLEAGEAEARRLRLVSRGRRASVEVSGASGALVVSSRLDREELCGKSAPCALRLEVLLDRPLRVFHVEVEVTDINDNAPRFPAASKNISVWENSPLNSRFPLEGASDVDIGSNAQLSYMLSPSEHFALDVQRGEDYLESLFLVLTKSLDRESLSEHRLVLTASDGGRPVLTGTVQLVISVLDANDNAPQFNQSVYKVQLPEDADAFSIDPRTGEIWLRELLDYEHVRICELQIEAKDKGFHPLSGHCKVVVEVLDVNDNAPAFSQAVYTVLARENNAAGAELARLWARDPDEAGNGRVSYSVAEGGAGSGSGSGWRPASSYVSVDAESGRLRALRPLDYEELQVLQFEVRAVDSGEPALCGNATVQLFVVDENDNAPALLPPAGGGPVPWAAGEAAEAGWPTSGSAGSAGSSWSLWARASLGAPAGQVVAKIRAVDADSGYNAWLRYELQEPRGDGPFRVGLYSGEVSTARVLEEADGPRQRLLIVVRDHGEPPRSATATLSVSLVEGPEAALAVSGVALAGSAGVGSDGGPSAAAAAQAAATNVWLVVAICAVSSLLVLAVVLYGAGRWAPRAAVLAGPGPATLVCASEVGSWSYSQRHSRSLCVATDGAGKSDLMVFSPNCPPPPGPAPKETPQDPPSQLHTAAWALVGGQVRYSVPEEAEAGTVVGRLAQDLGLEAGEAEARRLRLVSRGRRASVEVSGASGALVVSSRLDREELCGKSAPCALRLEVLLDRPLRVFHVEVEVTDINDNAPRFPAVSKNISISENSPMGTGFPLEAASDADIGSNAQLSYTLSPSEHFALDVKSIGNNKIFVSLKLMRPLDRESLSEHRLVLTASDGGTPSLTGTVQLVISVLDANDNAPQFNQSVYKVQLPEDARPGTVFLQLNATDKDEGINGDVYYDFTETISDELKELFIIDRISGEIRTAGKLDFEDFHSYDLEVEARDKGMPSLSGHCKVLLEVLDVNDNAPEVWVTSLSVPVSEDAALGTVVALLSVSDRDSGPNGRVRCAVRPPSPFGLVATFAGSYSLVLREALDRERVSEYEVEVRAEDGGAPPLRAIRGLRVPVSDVNDNAPAFSQAVYTVLARENNAAGAELARLWARDPDEAGNGRVSYSVAEGGAGSGSGSGSGWRPASSYVSVDAESGRLRALRPLDYEELQVLQFEVRAVDAGEPALCGNATVQLFVVDENDNAPALLPPAGGGPVPWAAGEAAEAGWPTSGSAGSAGSSWSLWARASLGAPAGQVVAKIRAVDADSGYNAWLRYELREPRGDGPFRVGLYSGEVSTVRALEEADGPRQRLLIVLRDHGEPPRSATATLSVSLVEGPEAALAEAVAALSGTAGVGSDGGPSAAAAAVAAATNVWLVVAICAVSSLLVLAVVLYGAGRWAPRAAVLAGPGPATLVCASEVGSWSYSQRHSRSLCVATDGAGKSDLMVFSPNCPPPPGPAPENCSIENGPSLSPYCSVTVSFL